MQTMCSSLTSYVSKVAGQFRNPIANQGKTTFKWHLVWPSNSNNLEQIRSLNYKQKIRFWLIKFREWTAMDNQVLPGPWALHNQITAPCGILIQHFNIILSFFIDRSSQILMSRCGKRYPTAAASVCWAEKQGRASNSDVYLRVHLHVMLPCTTNQTHGLAEL